MTEINLGPLTTTFTPSGPECIETFLAVNNDASWLKYGRDTPSCTPPGFKPQPGNYFSPGVCPQGYSYGCEKDIGFGVTEATCCPGPYTCITDRPADQNFACQSDVTSLTLLTIVVSVFRPFPPKQPTVTVMNAAYGTPIKAFGPVVRRGPGDASWPPSVMVTPSQTQSPELSGAEESSSASAICAEDGKVSGLSTGAAVGIGIGATLGAVVIVGAVVAAFLIARRKRRRRLTTPGYYRPYTGMSQHDTLKPPVELPTQSPVVGNGRAK